MHVAWCFSAKIFTLGSQHFKHHVRDELIPLLSVRYHSFFSPANSKISLSWDSDDHEDAVSDGNVAQGPKEIWEQEDEPLGFLKKKLKGGFDNYSNDELNHSIIENLDIIKCLGANMSQNSKIDKII